VRAAWLAVGLAGCSLIYDPGKAQPPPCPISPDRCPNEANASAFCQDTQCGYTCKVGYVDDDGDLGMPGSNGCETPCAACTPAPAYLEAVVGPVSGGVQLWWPDVDAGTKEAARILTYRVYEGSSPASVDLYENESDAGAAPLTSVTPINGTGASADGWNTSNTCGHNFFSDGGVFEIDTDLLCITSAYAGDALWQDYTMDVDVNISPAAFGNTAVTGGPVLWGDVSAGQAVLSATALPCPTPVDELSAFRAGFSTLAGAVECAPLQSWFAVRVVAQSSLASFQLGLDGGPLREVLRFRDSSPGATGRIGLGAGAFAFGGAVLFRNLRVSTRPQMPAGAPTSLHLDFRALPGSARILGAATTHSGACPSLPGATGCDAGECPAPDAGCLFVNTSDGGEAGLAFDLPVGLDPASSYELRFGYAPVAPAGLPDILRDPGGDLLGTADGGTLVWVGAPLDAGPSVGQWNAVDVLVAPDGGTLTLRWNGQPGVVAPISLDAGTADLTPLILGAPAGGAPMNGVYTPVEVIPR
jgi:hypothetical protein